MPLAKSWNKYLTQLLAQDVRKRIRDEIITAGVYSVSPHATPDTSNQDKLVVAARYVDSAGVPRDRVIEVKESLDKHGATTSGDILSSLTANHIHLHMLSFQTYDFTASMSARMNGAQKVLHDTLERLVPYISCQGHRSNTFNEHCYNHSALVTSMYH